VLDDPAVAGVGEAEQFLAAAGEVGVLVVGDRPHRAAGVRAATGLSRGSAERRTAGVRRRRNRARGGALFRVTAVAG